MVTNASIVPANPHNIKPLYKRGGLYYFLDFFAGFLALFRLVVLLRVALLRVVFFATRFLAGFFAVRFLVVFFAVLFFATRFLVPREAGFFFVAFFFAGIVINNYWRTI